MFDFDGSLYGEMGSLYHVIEITISTIFYNILLCQSGQRYGYI